MLILSFDKKRVFGKNEQKKKKEITGKVFTSLFVELFFSCLANLGEGRGEAGGTGEGEWEGGPREVRELPLGWRRRLLKKFKKIKKKIG